MGKESEKQIAVAKMKSYIIEHLQEAITASDIAKAVGYSQFHASRLFKEETGMCLFEYIRRERLVQSAYALRNGNTKVLDVALDFVFDSNEGFTRAFSNAFGITPRKYASYPTHNAWLIPYRYLNRQKTKSEGLKMSENTAVLFTQIVERPARKLILYRCRKADEYHSYCEEIGCCEPGNINPWDILCGIKEALYEPVGVWLPENMRPEGTGIYAHGVEVPADFSGEVPEGFDVIDLDPCLLMVFQGETYDDDNYEYEVGKCMQHIDKFNPEVYGYKYDETIAPKMQLAPMGWRGYIEMRPVVKIKD